MLKACQVKERILRRHYGVTTTRPFRKDSDPKKLLLSDGWQCACVMAWLAHKGERVADGTVRLHSFFYHLPEEVELEDADEQEHTISVYCCDENDAPEYGISEHVSSLCSVTFNLSQLPSRAFKERPGKWGTQVKLDIEMTFTSQMQIQLSWEEGVVRSAVISYE
jgi:hypothetical protein